MDVLSRELDILQSRFLEASAGTGKTFAIEQLIARFVLEAGYKIEEILAVTFTRKAAREMRERVRANFEKIAQNPSVDYLEGIDFAERLTAALTCFDEAQIFTIHGFCKRMLSEFAFEAHVAFEMSDENGRTLMRQVVRDFLKSGLQNVEDAEALLKESRQDAELLVDRIAHAIENPKQASPLVRKIANECRILWNEKQRQEELLTPDSLLEKMAEALERPAFVECVRAKYRALIVDEFQDTDPLSWKIFETIFLQDSRKIVYLVGDPKQSIYGFRSADINTYMRAAEQLGKEKRAHLSTNYRSRPELVDALNQLFTGPDWIGLSSFSYNPVRAGRTEGKLADESPIHFFLAQGMPSRERSWPTKQLEREKLFPYIASELARLRGKVAWSDMAVLVKDRFQAQRLHDFFESSGLPSSIRRTLNLAETPSFLAFEEVLLAALHPEDQSAVQRAQMGPLLQNEISFRQLHTALIHRGFPAFYQELVQNGLIVDSAVRQTAEILLEARVPPQHLGKVMQQLKKADPEEEQRLKLRSEEGGDRIEIMTLFASKGLEYDVVFSLGLASRHSGDEGEENDAEKMRQLYVALTRAREKLYIPLLFDKAAGSSPIELFWKRRFEVPLKVDHAVYVLEELPGVTFSWAEREPLNLPEEEKKPLILDTAHEPLPLFPKQYLASFSSLSKKATPTFSADVTGLPAGAETGTLVHAILERLFREGLYRDAASRQRVIKEALLKTSLETWTPAVEEMIARALEYPLWEGFCLKDLAPNQVIAELEFLYPKQERLIKGFVDLLFTDGKSYYILDWKTNWLDPKVSLKQCMEDHDYFLQAALYSEAVERYVKLFDNRPVAGAIYFFLRGPQIYQVTHEEMALSLAAR